MMNSHVNLANIKDMSLGIWYWWRSELNGVIESIPLLRQPETACFNVDKQGEIFLLESIEREHLNKRVIRLCIPENNIMYRLIRLPSAAASDINKVLEYEFDKYFPLSYSDVYTACKVTRQEDEPDMSVGIWAVRKNLLDEILNKICTKYQISPRQVILTNEENDLVVLNGVLSQQTQQRVNEGPVNNYAWIAIAILTIASLYIPILKLNQYGEALLEKASVLEGKVSDTVLIKKKMLEIEEKLNIVIEDKKNTPSFTEVWSSVTRLISGNGVLSTIRLTANKVVIEGKAVSVEKIVQSLEGSRKFSNVSIDAPVKRLEQGKYESMRLSFLVNGND